MSPPEAASELSCEQAYIDRAYDLLQASRERAAELRSMVEIGTGGTNQARYEHDVIEEAVGRRLSRLELGASSLVFGRIDFAAEDFYVGRMAVADERSEPVVVDWRAPIAEAFFRATSGDPLGLVRRRHFVCRGRELLGIEDEIFDLDGLDADPADAAVAEAADPAHAARRSSAVRRLRGHGALYAALEQRRDGRLTEVVATIQAEQDRVVRSPLRGVLVCQGGPGTGKTIVALHRAAYLLYTHRFPLEGQGVLIIGPNRLFLRYIERVMPSLGESGAHLFVLADLYNEIHPDVRVRLLDSPSAARVKGHAAMTHLIANAISDRQRRLEREVRVGYGLGYVTLTPERSREIVREAAARFRRHNAARPFVERRLFAALSESHRRAPDPASVRERIGRHPQIAAALEWMWPVLTPAQLLRDLFGSRALLRSAAKGLPFDDDDVDALWRERGDPDAYVWGDADVPLLDEAHQRLGPRLGLDNKPNDPPVRTYGHIVVDECQDHSPMALRMIARRSLNGSMTLVGDIAQTTAAGAAHSWEGVLLHLGVPDGAAREERLTLCYRIPEPSLRLANRVLADAAPELPTPAAVRIEGAEPHFVATAAADLPATVADTVRGESAALAGGTLIVVAPQSLMDALSDACSAAGLDFGRATAASRNATGVLHPLVTLAVVRLCKGLEADGVVVVEPTAICEEEPQGLRAAYVALTRATQRVAVVWSRPLPPSLA